MTPVDQLLNGPLPRLRDDLELVAGDDDCNGQPSWTVFDPARNQFFRLGAGFEMLSRWSVEISGAQLIVQVLKETTARVGIKEFVEFVEFLKVSQLVVVDDAGGVERLAAIEAAGKLGWFEWVVHHYLFIRIPLVRPDKYLELILLWVSWIGKRWAVVFIALMGLFGLLMVGRQWDAFVATFNSLINFDGGLAFLLTLGFCKSCHELGHALVAKRYGCRVPTMGVALLVMMPVLYTDVTDSWRLGRRQRMLVSVAGVAVEIALAAMALFLWSFLPVGVMKSAAFLVATSTLATTLLINMSPFMRFDGYYLLSDWLGVPNLQVRAFSMARWQVRRLLLGCADAPPERVGQKMRLTMVVYAWATWAYRLVLFLGIAALVYGFFVKLLGIVMFAVEIGYFLVLPIAKELIVLVRRGLDMKINGRMAASMMVGLVLVLGAVVPWSATVAVPAVLRAASVQVVYPPVAGRVADVRIAEGMVVKAGDVLVRLASDELAIKQERAVARKSIAEIQMARVASDDEDRSNSTVYLQQRISTDSEIKGAQESIERLTIRASVGGVIRDVPTDLTIGAYVSPSKKLGVVVGEGRVVDGLVGADGSARIAPQALGRFFPVELGRGVVEVAGVSMADVNAAVLDQPMLASTQGGPVAVHPVGRAGEVLRPVQAVYRVSGGAAVGGEAADRVMPGVLMVDGRAESLASGALRRVVGVLIRESGF